MQSSQKSTANDFPLYLFHQGKNFEAHKFFGAHPFRRGRGQFYRFRVWAPHAKSVSVIGEFNGWNRTANPMHKISDTVWEAELPRLKQFDSYKYSIETQDGRILDKADPYAAHYERRPGTASKLFESEYVWGDREWMLEKKKHVPYKSPMNIYEVNISSWKHNPAEKFPSYIGFAEEIIPYLKKMSYTHVEFMPLTEYPFDGSWGYQVTGYFAPTSRHGTPDDFRKMIDLFHQAGIGVILDFVPVHFAVDGYALNHYDGTTLYEYPEKEDNYSEWGSCNFIHARGEVCSFLQSCANYWMDVFHFDGLRMDAVSRLIYWGGDPNRGTNPSSINFLKRMNQGLHQLHPEGMLIAEDSTNYEGVTCPVEYGGLGFDYKWDMGWMNDTLDYFRQYPWVRRDEETYHKLTFSMMYFPNEYYLLPLSHDENVHGKATVMQKMFGEYEQKFPQARLLYLYMYAHPGKKLLFMGSELGQLREWTEEEQQDWDILKYPIHDAFYHFMLELNKLYLTEPALYRDDYERNGFCWVDCHQEQKGIYAMERRSGDSRILILLHMSDEATQNYTFTLPDCGGLKPLLHTDWERFHGSVKESKRTITGDTTRTGMQFTLELPPFSGIMLRILPEKPKQTTAKPAAKRKTAAGRKTTK